MPNPRMGRLTADGEVEETQPFDNEPDDFAFFVTDRWLPAIERGSRSFHPRGYSLVLHLEMEAIEALADRLPGLPQRPVMDDGPIVDDAMRATIASMKGRFKPAAPPPKRAVDTEDAAHERWLRLWVREAWSLEPFQHSKKEGAAIGILITASKLRTAIQDGQAEKAAALGMLLAFTAIEGGYSLKLQDKVEKAETLSKIRRRAFVNGAGKTHADLQRAKSACLATAKKLWEADSTLRIGEVATRLRNMLTANIEKFQTLKPIDVPEVETVKTWLKDAAKDGKLKMPATAQRRGRPTKSPNNK